MGSQNAGKREPTSERPASQVDDDRFLIGWSLRVNLAERLGEFLNMADLVQVSIDQYTIPWREVAPRFVETRLSAPDSLHRFFERISKN